jgi:hypothetical protein
MWKGVAKITKTNNIKHEQEQQQTQKGVVAHEKEH